ncbi:Soluble aldose sugar dehydrogenase YliI precursor [Thiorhodovibrio winogradskyi]|uniref:Soluble aldose sugar dehydrogenase YliI n=1 Tax=Thiorhodovibrio winogradskyi TaxID=77007 RepID=A0ABZ0SEK1_9GAMM|nr:PQQ-dependent sugar dehydrogenase [Thiorhodovibrio winogradskyi]
MLPRRGECIRLVPSRRARLAASLLLLTTGALAASPPSSPEHPSTKVQEASGWRLETVAEGLEHPWSIAWLPNGQAVISERPGRLRLLAEGRLQERPISGLPRILALGQGGLLDLAPHPNFAENRWLYLSYSVGSEDANRVRIGRGRFEDGQLHDFEVIYQNPETKSGGQHFGSRLLWLPDGSLLVSLGDGGNPPISFNGEPIRNQAQALGTVFGKVLRLNADGSPHPENPFVDEPDARAEIFTFGHRNIQGLALNPADASLWASEHGARGGDEINRLSAGGDYGWPRVTYSREYWGPRISESESSPGVIAPLVVWTPSIAPSGLTFYTGQEFPDWQGDLFAGALKFRELRRIDLEDGRPVAEEKFTIGRRVRDVRQGPDAGLYLLTDENPGQLLRLRPTGD